MDNDIIQELWNKGEPPKKEFTVEEIERALRPDVRRQSTSIRMFVWLWLVILLGTLVLDALNIAGYIGNPVMLTTTIGLALLGVMFGIYGIHLLRELNIMDCADESMMVLLQRRRRFYRTKFEIWNVMMALILLLLTFAVNTYVDNDNGTYTINRVEIFIGFSILQFAFMYGINRIAQYPIRKEMKIFLADLEANGMEATQKLVVFRKQWRIWTIVFAIIGTILFLLGIWRAMQMGS